MNTIIKYEKQTYTRISSQEYRIGKSVCHFDFRITVNKTEVSTYVFMENKI